MPRSFSTKGTRPDVHGSWTDHIQLVDGHWSPDGSSLVVSDVAGQWHMYSVGAPTMVKHARYDQFLESDYDRLTRDVNNAVIDDNTQQPPHLRPTRYPCRAPLSLCCFCDLSVCVTVCAGLHPVHADHQCSEPLIRCSCGGVSS